MHDVHPQLLNGEVTQELRLDNQHQTSCQTLDEQRWDEFLKPADGRKVTSIALKPGTGLKQLSRPKRESKDDDCLTYKETCLFSMLSKSKT